MYKIGREELLAVQKVIEARQTFRYSRGKVAEFTGEFESKLANRIGVRHALATTSGTASLICSLVGLGVGPGDEVIVPGYTFIATALAPLAVGAVPIIAEVDETLTIDPKDVERKITRYTKAIIPVYMLGLPCNMDALLRISRKHGIPLVEDVAQASGGSYHGKPFGSMGRVAAFSFNHYKILVAGEGGALVTDDDTVFRRAMIYHDCGCVFFDEKAKDIPFFAGVNYRINEFQSAMLNVQMGRLPGILRDLRARKAAMRQILSKSKNFRVSKNHDVRGDCSTNLPILFPTAEKAIAFKQRFADICPSYRPIDTDRHVYTNWQPILKKQAHHPKLNPWKWAKREISYSAGMCPQTLDILARTICISLPLTKTVTQLKAIAKKLID